MSTHYTVFLDSVSMVVSVGPLALALVIDVKAELFLDRVQKFRTDIGLGKIEDGSHTHIAETPISASVFGSSAISGLSRICWKLPFSCLP